MQLVNPRSRELGLLPLFDRDSGSTYNLDKVASFLDNCTKSHAKCPSHETPLPFRVVDVGDSSHNSLRLVEPGKQNGKYACLSYCVSPGHHDFALDSTGPWLVNNNVS